jgi:uncharacterized membrane protein
MPSIGPVQLLVVGFDSAEPKPELRAELELLRENPAIRVIDLLHVRKHEDGRIEKLQMSDLSDDESIELGAVVGALIGLGAGGEEGAELGALAGAAAAADGESIAADLWYVDDQIPAGSAATVALVEHRWAIGLRDKVRESGGALVAEAWIHPSDLVAIGLVSAAEADQELIF